MASNSEQPPQDLNYPPVRVDQSLTELDLDTLMMRSTPTPKAEEPGSSLDDSTYELLGDSLLDTSDDEAHTASIASTEGPTPDDASEFSDDDDIDDDYGTGVGRLQDSMQSSLAGHPGQHSDLQMVTAGEDSTLTEVPTHMEDTDSTKELKLEEQSADTSHVVQGCKTIKNYETDDMPPVLSHYGKQVKLVARAALSERPMPALDSYTILFIGMPERWLEDNITSRIEAALATSPTLAKSDAVHHQSEPDGPVTRVYRCNEIRTITEGDRPTHVLVILDDGQQLTFGPKLGSNASTRPDLVVFCHPTIFNADKQEFATASEVFRRQEVPYIDLALAPSYGDGAITADHKSLRLCIEGRDDPNADYKLKEVLPLNYYHFSKLEPTQLNRHLALISPHLSLRSSLRNQKTTGRSWFGKTSYAIKKNLGPRWSLLKTLTVVLMSLITVPALLRGAAYAPLLFGNSPTPQPDVQSAISSSHLTICHFGISTTETSTALSVPAVPTPSLSALSLVPPPAKIPRRKYEKKADKLWQFDIETTGSHQFILKPSKSFAASRAKPQLQISILQGSQAVPVQYNRTIGGEYIVDLERQYPFSSFNVSIASYSKPLLRQSFEIVLGHNMSRLDLLLDTAKSNLIETQVYLADMSSYAGEQMREKMANAKAVAQSCVGEVQGPYERALEQLGNVQQVLERQAAISTRMLHQASGATWTSLRQATAPIRASTPMMRARMNALRLRCELEVAAGLSDKNMGGRQSWACSKVQGGSQE
jgi:hypothetical protein